VAPSATNDPRDPLQNANVPEVYTDGPDVALGLTPEEETAAFAEFEAQLEIDAQAYEAALMTALQEAA